MQQALHAATEVDEGAELAHGGDAPFHHGAGDDRSPDLGGARLLSLLEKDTARDHDVPAAFLVFRDSELVDVSFVRRRIGPQRVDLRDRTEGALPADADFVSALHGPLDPSFHRKTGTKGVFELPAGRGRPRQLPREDQPFLGRHDHRLNAVADGHVELAIRVLQFVDFYRGFALAADVDEGHLRANGDDRALERLAFLEALRFRRSLEHRGEVFFRFGHPVQYAAGSAADASTTSVSDSNFSGRRQRRGGL